VSKLQKSRLGRGLSSLISVSSTPVEVEIPPLPTSAVKPLDLGVDQPAPVPAKTTLQKVQNEPIAAPAAAQLGQPVELPIELIQPNPHQPRKQIDEAKVAELAASLKSTGVIQPIVVRKQGDGYELIAGERRWRAAKFAGMSTVPAIVREVSSFEQAQMALVENIQREDLNPMDRAQGYRTLLMFHASVTNLEGEDRVHRRGELVVIGPAVEDPVFGVIDADLGTDDQV